MLHIKKRTKGEPISNPSRLLFTTLNVTCTMQVMLVLHAAICINMFKNTENRLPYWLVGFRDKHSLASRDLTKNFSVPKKCTNKFDYLLYEMFLFKNRDLLSMCSRTQFVQGILIRFLIFFLFSFWFPISIWLFLLFVCSYCPFTLPKNFLLFTRTYIFIVTFLLFTWKWPKFNRIILPFIFVKNFTKSLLISLIFIEYL